MSLVRIFLTRPGGIVAESWKAKVSGGYPVADLNCRCEPLWRTTTYDNGSLANTLSSCLPFNEGNMFPSCPDE